MFLENNFINLSNKTEINNVYSYKMIITKFINIFILIYKNKYSYEKKFLKKSLIDDAYYYSKYYLYYKIMNCIYDNNIMEIIFTIDNFSYIMI